MQVNLVGSLVFACHILLLLLFLNILESFQETILEWNAWKIDHSNLKEISSALYFILETNKFTNSYTCMRVFLHVVDIYCFFTSQISCREKFVFWRIFRIFWLSNLNLVYALFYLFNIKKTYIWCKYEFEKICFGYSFLVFDAFLLL